MIASILRTALFLVVVLALSSGAFAGQAGNQQVSPAVKKPVAAKPAAPRMTNADVVKMVKSGLGDELVIAAIRKSVRTAFDTSVDGLVALKEAGISDQVISTMMDPKASTAMPVVPAPSAPKLQGDGQVPNRPSSSQQQMSVSFAAPSTATVEGRQAGIYVVQGNELVPLEPSTFSGARTGGIFKSAVTMGLAKQSWKAVVRSPRSQLRVSNTPVFYFYFEQTGAGLSNAAGWSIPGLPGSTGVTSPNEFVLANMTAKKNERELIVLQAWAFGTTAGTRSKDTVEMKIERIRPGVYKVTSASPLLPGEYCFYYAGGTTMQAGMVSGGRLWDFGVQ